MDERVVSTSVSGSSDPSSSLLVIPSHDLCSRRSEDWYPVYFGVSCAFFAFRLLSGRGGSSEEEEDGGPMEVCDKMLWGSAQLLGVLVWKSQKIGFDEEKREIRRKLQAAERGLEDLRRVRREDARANEKVVGIFAAQEQRWFGERRRLQQRVGSLVNDVRVLANKKDEVISELNGKVKELEVSVLSKEKLLEEERIKVAGLEEKLQGAEIAAEDLRERVKRESQEHSSKIWKHKTAFIELVSNHRRIEAELDRALRQVEATKREFEYVLAQKEESASMAKKLSSELVKMQKDAEQKDKVLSAMLRKSRSDTDEKQVLMKDVKSSKSKKKQAEFEAERFKSISEAKDKANSLRNVFANQVSSKLQSSSSRSRSRHTKNSRSQSQDLLEYDNQDLSEDIDRYSAKNDGYLPDDYKRLDDWVRLEAEKYAKAIEHHHHLEVDAFVGQMRIKDEKLEEFRWRLLSMEIESKHLHSHVEALTEEISQLRLDNTKLEAALISREEELDSLKESGKHRQEAEETEAARVGEICPEEDSGILESPSTSQQSEFRAVQSPERESEEEKEVDSHSITTVEVRETPANISKAEQSLSMSQLSRNPPWKMDLQALGVFYKIKRLKQQLLMLERLIGKQDSCHDADGANEQLLGMKNFLSLISVLNKQVGRYQSLQERTDDLCKRKHDKDLDMTRGDSDVLKTKARKSKELEVFLEETFQLQRYMVATGQKMMEIQSKVADGYVGAAEQVEKSVNIDMKRFCDGLRSLFRDVQGGLEVRITRIIGDLEGTLARDGMIHLR